MKRLLCCLALLAALQGCNGMNMQNPFDTSTTTTNETYYDQFEDVPIPADMNIDRTRTLITTAQDGTRMGLLTAEGRIEINSLAQAMANNMSRQGWTLTGKMSGVKHMQVFEKDARVVVLYFYEQTVYTAMEVWMSARLSGFSASPAMRSGTMPSRNPVSGTELSQ